MPSALPPVLAVLAVAPPAAHEAIRALQAAPPVGLRLDLLRASPLSPQVLRELVAAFDAVLVVGTAPPVEIASVPGVLVAQVPEGGDMAGALVELRRRAATGRVWSRTLEG